MAPRAIWKGYLKVGELTCPVSLFSAATVSERVSFHMLNRKTGHRLRRQYVDEDTGKPVDRNDQVKGYETSKDHMVILEPDEIAEAVPEGDKTLDVEAFLPCDEVDTVYLDKPYYLAPSDDAAEKAFAVIREGMRAKKVAAVATSVLFRRVRSILIRPQGRGLAANTLNFDYEIRDAGEVFAKIPQKKIDKEMLKLAKHIISTKSGKFDITKFDDRYDNALAELVKAKQAGKKIEPPKREPESNVIDLMDALRKSAGKAPAKAKPKRSTKGKKASEPKRKAG